MKNYVILAILLVCCILVGCDTKGEPVDYANVCSKASDGKTVETSGFLDDAGGVFCSNTSGRMECGFKLKTDLKDEKGFSADIAIGSGANSMDKLESGYQKTDIKVRNNDGNAIDMSKAVKVTGKVSFSDDPTYTSGPVCYMKVYKIEQ